MLPRRTGGFYVPRENFGGLDSTGNLVVKYVYDAWGNHKVLDAVGAEMTDTTHIGHINPFRYRGYYFDNDNLLIKPLQQTNQLRC